MKKIDLHMHVMTTLNLPKLGKLNLSGPKKMIAHMEELGIKKAVLMSTGEKKTAETGEKPVSAESAICVLSGRTSRTCRRRSPRPADTAEARRKYPRRNAA